MPPLSPSIYTYTGSLSCLPNSCHLSLPSSIFFQISPSSPPLLSSIYCFLLPPPHLLPSVSTPSLSPISIFPLPSHCPHPTFTIRLHPLSTRSHISLSLLSRDKHKLTLLRGYPRLKQRKMKRKRKREKERERERGRKEKMREVINSSLFALATTLATW